LEKPVRIKGGFPEIYFMAVPAINRCHSNFTPAIKKITTPWREVASGWF